MKNYKFFQGDVVIFKYTGNEGRLSDLIIDMTDSTVIFEMMGEVRLEDISCIYRENWFVNILSGLSLLGGTAYFGLDSFNRMINHEYPVVDTGTLMISAGMVAFSAALIPLKYRKINTWRNWKISTLDPGLF